jgi:hypothetical protein
VNPPAVARKRFFGSLHAMLLKKLHPRRRYARYRADGAGRRVEAIVQFAPSIGTPDGVVIQYRTP